MANLEQLEILKAGVEVWNRWRAKTSIIECDLSNTNLSNLNFAEANFRNVNFVQANLTNSIFEKANLINANLSASILTGTNFKGACLGEAKLSAADLTDADFSSTDLCYANLSGAMLSNVDFSYCTLGTTIFGSTRLINCKGLETIEVENSCTIDFQTLRASNNLPDTFLLKIGLPQIYIDYLPEFFHDFSLFPAFLSHSWKNNLFVSHLYNKLIGRGVNVYIDKKKMKPGDDLYESISKGIQDYDKMILVCSKESLTESWWVDRELDRVLAKERELYKKHGKRINLLIPITLDDYIFEWDGAKAEEVRRYIIGDFRPEADFEKSLNDLVHALHVERPDVKPPSFL